MAGRKIIPIRSLKTTDFSLEIYFGPWIFFSLFHKAVIHDQVNNKHTVGKTVEKVSEQQPQREPVGHIHVQYS